MAADSFINTRACRALPPSRRSSRGSILPQGVQHLNRRDELHFQRQRLVATSDPDIDSVARGSLAEDLLDLLKGSHRLTVERRDPITHSNGLAFCGDGAG